MSWNPAGIKLGQAVEILVDHGTAGYGSGYLISPALVLTARHVTEPGGPIDIVHGGCQIPAALRWHGLSPEVDIAVLGIADPVDAPGISVPAFGDLSRACVRRVPFDVVGYPRHKQRVVGGAAIRDTDQVSGEIPAGANLKTGVLDLLRDGRPLNTGDDWAGLSGAAVFCRGLLVGVVVEAEEHGPLRALPLAPLLERSRQLLEPYQEPAESIERLLAVLHDGGVATRVWPVHRRPSYRQAEELVSATPDLVGRDAEYQQLRRVAQSDVPYSLWLAGPWAGKTTLAAHFAASPQAGIDVVSFFISRSRGQQAPQYWAAIGDQLAAIVDEPAPAQPELAFTDLWIRARDQVTGQGRRLVLLVDGVDENSQPPPIIQDLPREPGPGAHVTVFTRPAGDVFQDLLDHPLGAGPDDTTRCARFALASSGLARDLGRRALIDLRDLLTMNDRAPRQVLSLLAAVGPLSVTDMTAILATEGVPADEGDVRRGVAAASRVLTVIGSPAELYAVAHEALREEISRQVNPAPHVAAALIWAGRFAAGNWPDTTPSVLADGYLPLLLLTGDPARVREIASQSRARYMRLRTGDDVAHGRELLGAFDAIAAREEPDLATACVLARARAELELGYDQLPVDLAVGWGRVGQLRRCEHLTSYLQLSFDRVKALLAAAEWAAHHAEHEEASRFLGMAVDETLAEDGGNLLTPLDIAKFAYWIGEHETAVRLSARAVAAASEDSQQVRAQSAHVVLTTCGSEELLQAGGFREALDSLDLEPVDKVWGFLTLTKCTSGYRQPDLARALLDDAETAAHQLQGWWRASALLQVAEGALAAGDTRRARRLIGLATREDQCLEGDAEPLEFTCEAARLAAQAGDGDRAKRLLNKAETRIRPQDVDDLCAVGVAAAESGDRTRALRLFHQALGAATASRIAHHLTASVAEAAARAGEIDLAVQWLHMAEAAGREKAAGREWLKWAGAKAIFCLPAVADATARSGQAGAVLRLAQAAGERSDWNIVMGVITGLARAGAIREAQLAAELLPDRGDTRDGAAAPIAQAAAAAGDWRLATDMAAQISGFTLRNDTLAVIGHAAADRGKWQVAEQAAHQIADSPYHRNSVLADAATAAMEGGQETAARRILRQLPDGWPRLRATLQAMQAAQHDSGDTSQVTLIERALAAALHGGSGYRERRDRVHNLIFLIRAASSAGSDAVLPRLIGALVDAVRDVDDLVSRTFDACAAADDGAAGNARVRTTLLTIAEEAAVQADDTDHTTRLKSAIEASARHGDHERVDRLLPLLAAQAENGGAEVGSRESVAETAAYAGRFGYADHVISSTAPWGRQQALLAAIRGALNAAPHRTDATQQAEARSWTFRWVLAALRIDLDPELARLMVMMCPDVASLALSWFEPAADLP